MLYSQCWFFNRELLSKLPEMDQFEYYKLKVSKKTHLSSLVLLIDLWHSMRPVQVLHGQQPAHEGICEVEDTKRQKKKKKKKRELCTVLKGI